MKALSIRQPWAWAIMAGHKPIENRSWNTKHRGMLMIHAALKVDMAAYDFLRAQGLEVPAPKDLPKGVLLGTVMVEGVVQASTSPYFFGPLGFMLSEPLPFKQPFPYRGRLGLFEVPNEAWARK